MLNDESVKIRFATPEDAALLAEIGRRSFYDAFKDHPKNAPTDMRLYMDSAFGVEIQTKELKNERTVYLIVEVAGETVGFIKLHKDSSEKMVTGDRCLEIARFYLLQEWIGRGVSKQMMQTVLDWARENGFDTIWLGVWEYNYRAQAFYKKWGFEHVGEHVFPLGNDPQTDWVWQRKT